MAAEATSGEGATPQSGDYLSTLQVQKGFIALVTVTVVAVAMGFSLLQDDLYESEAKVLVEPLALTPGQEGVAPNMETEKQVVESAAVAELAANKLGISGDLEGLVEPLTVEVETSAEILTIRYEHADPAQAQSRAQAFAEAYLTFRRQRAENELLSSSAPLQQQLDQLEQQLAEVNDQIANATNPAQEATLTAEAGTLIDQIAIIRQQLSQLTAADSIRVGQIVDDAELPASPSKPNLPLNLALALLVGGSLGVGLAFVRERISDRPRGSRDLEHRVGAPLLGMVPTHRVHGDGRDPNGESLVTPHSPAAEAYRTLRAGLAHTMARTDVRSVLITSPNPGEGKSSVVANLGVSLARAKKRVVMVSADLRHPTLHRVFGLPHDVGGLTDVLDQQVELFTAVRPTETENLRILPSGWMPGNHDEMLGSMAMETILQTLRDDADVVLVDGPPVLPVADAVILAQYVDCVLLVLDAETTTGGAVDEAMQRLKRVDARIIGSVLNNFTPSTGRHYGYGGYGREYADAGE